MKRGFVSTIQGIWAGRGFSAVVVAMVVGLFFSQLLIRSVLASVVVGVGILVLVFAVLVRKTEYLIYLWFILAFLVLLILDTLPGYYRPIVGRAIFWGLPGCIAVAWWTDNILMGRGFRPFKNAPITAITVSFVLWGLIAVFASMDVLLSAQKFSHIVIGVGLSYIFYDFFSRDERNLKRSFNLLYLLIAVMAFMVVGLAFHGLVTGVPIYKRISLWFFNTNSVGLVLSMTIPVLVAAKPDSVSWRWHWTITVAMMLALFFSFSRTSWLAAAASLGYLLWTGRMKIPVWALGTMGLIVGAVVVPLIGIENITAWLLEERYTGRSEIWKAAFLAACDHPLVGVGPGNATEVLGQYMVTPWLMKADTHSAYLKNAVEMGFPSLALWVAFYVSFFYYAIRIVKKIKGDYLRDLSIGAVAALIGIGVHGLAENGFFLTPFVGGGLHSMLPYILVVVPFASERLEKKGL